MNYSIKNIEEKKKTGMWISVFALVIGLFFSRALISIGIIGIALFSFHRERWLLTFRVYRKMFTGLIILVGIVIISGLWSEDLSEWWHRVQMKLPILIIPISLLSYKSLDDENIKWLYLVFIQSVIVGCLFCFGYYLFHLKETQLGYSQGRVMYVPFAGDHQRFSWAVIGSCWLIWLGIENGWINKKTGITIIMLLVAFIHFLATRTALACTYLSILIFALYQFRTNKKIALYILVGLLALPTIAFFVSTPFKNKVYYMLYDFNQYKNQQMVEGLSDGARYVAMQSTIQMIKAHALLGVGYGDIKEVNYAWYDAHAEYSSKVERLMPPSQYLYYICAAGILGLILFPYSLYLLWIGVPDSKKSFAFYCFQITSAFLLFFETPWEVQLGAVLYGLLLSLILLGKSARA